MARSSDRSLVAGPALRDNRDAMACARCGAATGPGVWVCPSTKPRSRRRSQGQRPAGPGLRSVLFGGHDIGLGPCGQGALRASVLDVASSISGDPALSRLVTREHEEQWPDDLVSKPTVRFDC